MCCDCESEACVVSAEERKRLVRRFDERQGEAEEMVSCSDVHGCFWTLISDICLLTL